MGFVNELRSLLMRNVLAVISILSFLAGAGILSESKTAIHEIEGFLLFLISASTLSGAGIIEAIQRATATMKAIQPVTKP